MLLNSAARSAVAWSAALLLLQGHFAAAAGMPSRSKCYALCACLVLLVKLLGPQVSHACGLRPWYGSRRTLRNDQEPQGTRLVTSGFSASSHLSLCEPATLLRYRLNQCSAAAAVIFVHGKASSSADLLRCSHYTEA